MHAQSKGYRRFIDRMNCFLEDMEVVDIFYRNLPLLEDERVIFRGVTPTYQRLIKRQANRQSRTLVMMHLKHTLYVSVIKEIYEEVMDYLGYVLNCGALCLDEPGRLVGDQKFQMTANEILSTASREEIVTIVMANVFRKLENKRDTLLLVTELNERLALNIDDSVINRAMPFLEARHVFVHADGIADDDYKQKHPTIQLTEKGQIKLNATIMHNAVSQIKALIAAFEQKMQERNYFPLSEFE